MAKLHRSIRGQSCKSTAVSLPFLTAELPGIGGVLRTAPEDFEVEELPAYLPSGNGDHVYVLIEKRDLTTPFAISQLARAAGVSPRDVGSAGMKDRRAVTRQWLSLPPPVTLEQVQALPPIEGLRLLEIGRHNNKLRTGHLRGNRFALVVRGCALAGAELLAAARACLAALAAAPGAPNWYGEQRFGRDGDNAAQGLALLRKERRFDRDPRKNRLLVSALQSRWFNEWLERRLRDGLFRDVLAGDVLRKVSGGSFVCSEPDVDRARLRAGEVVATGPMFGVEMKRPAEDSPAAAREAQILAEAGVTFAELASLRKLAPGARRDAAIALAEVSVEEVAGDATAVRVRFTLPAGAYATAVMRELLKLPEESGASEGGEASEISDASEPAPRPGGDGEAAVPPESDPSNLADPSAVSPTDAAPASA